MPTKSNNTGGHGGRRSGAGKKSGALKDKIESGANLYVLDIPELEEAEMPEPEPRRIIRPL